MKTGEATFRAFRPDDAGSIAHNLNNINVWNNLRDMLPHPYTEKDAADFIALSLAADPMVNFAIDLDGQAIGGVGYVPHSDVQRISAEVGYWIGEEYRGRGIVPQVLAGFTDYVFAETGVMHLYASVFEGNAASMRALVKAGFAPVGIMHGAAIKNGQVIDLHYYEKFKAR